MKKKFAFQLAIALLFVLPGQAQIGNDNPPLTDYNNIKMPESPNAASFTKYGKTTVNTATGVPNINIPLYTYEMDGVSIPISISYNASGVKVTDLASVVGLNWTLNTGGAISRTIRSKADDNEGWLDDDYTFLDNYWYDSYNPNDPKQWQRKMTGSFVNLYKGFAKKNDHSPDWFSYSFLGNSGNFILATDGHLIKEKQDGLDIFLDGSPISYLTVKDLKGNEFLFDIHEKSNNFNQYDSGGENIDNYSWESGEQLIIPTTAWMPSRITTKNNKTIHFSYTPIDYEYTIADADSRITLTHSCGTGSGSFGGSFQHTHITYKYNTQRMDRIWSPDGNIEVLFEYETTTGTNTNAPLWKEKLVKITVNDHLSGKKKEFIFEYETFGGDPRLKLKKVFERGFIGTTPIDKPPHIFTYNGDYMPQKNSFSQDIYGYYNGKSASSLVHNSYSINNKFHAHPSTSTFLNGKLGDRSLGQQQVKNGILERIDYPTGGWTEFFYDPNELDGRYLGGLRIREVTDYDETGGYNKKTYQYADLKGTALLNHIELTYKDHQNGSTSFNSGAVGVPGELNNPYSPGYFYGEVTVTSINGRERYKEKFRYAQNYYALHKFDYSLVEEIQYKGNQEIKMREYIYDTIGAPELFSWNVLGVNICFNEPNGDSGVGYGYGSLVRFQGNYGLLPTTIATTEFLKRGSSLQPVTTVKYIDYDAKTLLKTHEITDTRRTRRVLGDNTVDYPIVDTEGEMTTVDYAYPWDDDIGLDDLPPALPMKVAVNSFKEGAQISGQDYEYDTAGNIKATFKATKGVGSNNSSLNYIDDTYERESTFIFDNGKPVQVTPYGGIPTSYIWGYNGQLPVASIEGIPYYTISGSGRFAAIQAASNSPNNEGSLLNELDGLRTDYPTAMVTTYTHLPLYGVSTITDPKGDRITYHYDEFGRLKYVTDKQGNILTENEYHYGQ